MFDFYEELTYEDKEKIKKTYNKDVFNDFEEKKTHDFIKTYGYYPEGVRMPYYEDRTFDKLSFLIFNEDILKFKNEELIIEFGNFNSWFNGCLRPLKELKEVKGIVRGKEIFNNKAQMYLKSDFISKKNLLNFKVRFKCFKGKSTDLYFVHLNFKKNIKGFARFLALLGVIKSSWKYKGHFTKYERSLIWKLKNPLLSGDNLEELKEELEELKEEIEKKQQFLKNEGGIIEAYDDLKKRFYKTGHKVPIKYRNKFIKVMGVKEELKTLKKEYEDRKEIYLNIEDKYLNTNALWFD